jgi:hypothetical protein
MPFKLRARLPPSRGSRATPRMRLLPDAPAEQSCSYGFMRFRRCLPSGTSILVSHGESANRLPRGPGAAGLVQRERCTCATAEGPTTLVPAGKRQANRQMVGSGTSRRKCLGQTKAEAFWRTPLHLAPTRLFNTLASIELHLGSTLVDILASGATGRMGYGCPVPQRRAIR